jgi:hypothetical protein
LEFVGRRKSIAGEAQTSAAKAALKQSPFGMAEAMLLSKTGFQKSFTLCVSKK